MSEVELIERLTELVKQQADIIKAQADALAQCGAITSLDERVALVDKERREVLTGT